MGRGRSFLCPEWLSHRRSTTATARAAPEASVSAASTRAVLSVFCRLTSSSSRSIFPFQPGASFGKFLRFGNFSSRSRTSICGRHIVSHAWSLAVEDQFYLLLPLILVFVSRKPKAGIVIPSRFFSAARRCALFWRGCIQAQPAFLPRLSTLDLLSDLDAT